MKKVASADVWMSALTFQSRSAAESAVLSMSATTPDTLSNRKAEAMMGGTNNMNA
jgi:hypothetical protein